jgi:hypothetical protein
MLCEVTAWLPNRSWERIAFGGLPLSVQGKVVATLLRQASKPLSL